MMIKVLKGFWTADGKINLMVVHAVRKAVVDEAGQAATLCENERTLKLVSPWARKILYNTLGWPKRQVTTDCKLTN